MADRKTLVPLLLPADPTAALQAATKQYVDSKATDKVEVAVQPGTPTDNAVVSGTVPNLWIDTDDVLPANQGMVIPGGATGTFLQKKSATDFDVQWYPARTYVAIAFQMGPWAVGTTVTVNVPFKADVVMVCTASCFGGTGMCGMYPYWDGAAQPYYMDQYFNEPSSHKTVASTNVMRGVAAGNHTVSLGHLANTSSDSNDRAHWAFTMTEVP